LVEKQMISEQQQPEWMDLKSLQRYACVSERTLREWIHRPTDPLPAARVGAKILVRRGLSIAGWKITGSKPLTWAVLWMNS
jgi:hypothetical protein